VNMPEQATTEEIMETYVEGWKRGLKALAIYRDGCKRSQPVSTGKNENKSDEEMKPGSNGSKAHPLRRRLPNTRDSITHKFEIGGHEGYLTVGLYEDGSPGELFITMAKEGSTIGGLMDAFGTAISICLQYGVEVKTLVNKFVHTRFEPSGFTKNPDIPIAKSLMDYIFRWMGLTFVKGYKASMTGGVEEDLEGDLVTADPAVQTPVQQEALQKLDDQFAHFMEDAPICDTCGSLTVRNGACYRCFNCGNSMGCS
jgi:ribonucleoside-diphosphate reductase alpha chain